VVLRKIKLPHVMSVMSVINAPAKTAQRLASEVSSLKMTLQRVQG
jgi:hypothetical protein